MQRCKNAKCKFLGPDTKSISSLEEKIWDTLNYHNYQTINYHNKKYFEKKLINKNGFLFEKSRNYTMNIRTCLAHRGFFDHFEQICVFYTDLLL